jgi:hypothetical protein
MERMACFRIAATALARPLGASAAAAADRPPAEVPPVALHQEAPTIPQEAAGSSAAPAVTVRVTVDARGRPSTVETLRVEPAGPFDAAFAKATREALSRWRFAPALKHGAPAESVLEWTVQFAALPAGASPLDGAEAPALPRAVEEDAAVARRRVAVLPPTGRRDLRDETAWTADNHLEGGRRITALTEHFEVVTDSAAPGVAERIGKQLESAFGVVSRLFDGAIPEEAASDRILAYVFAKHASFGAFATENPRSLGSGAGGFYDPAGLLAFHLEIRGGSDALLRVLLHEATHAFLHAHVARPGVTLPLWLDEGLAEYVAASGSQKGGVTPGARTRKRTADRRAAAKRRGEPPRAGADEVEKAVRAGGAISLDQLLAARDEDMEGEKARLFPVQSWMWVHFLRHGKPGWASGSFPRLVLYIAEGFVPADVFRAVYGSSPADLDGDFREYVKRF